MESVRVRPSNAVGSLPGGHLVWLCPTLLLHWRSKDYVIEMKLTGEYERSVRGEMMKSQHTTTFRVLRGKFERHGERLDCLKTRRVQTFHFNERFLLARDQRYRKRQSPCLRSSRTSPTGSRKNFSSRRGRERFAAFVLKISNLSAVTAPDRM